MAKPTQRLPAPPEWASDAGSTVAPTLPQSQAGWPQGFRPPARWQNDWQRRVWQTLDVFYETMLKTWIRGEEIDVGATRYEMKGIGWADGLFMGVKWDGTDHYLWKSVDGMRWVKGNIIGLLGTSSQGGNSVASDGSRICVGSDNTADPGRYSDDGGENWLTITDGGGFDEKRIAYMPNAGIWIANCEDTNSYIQSADGLTWVAIPGTFRTDGANYNAESEDGVNLIAGGSGSNAYSTDGGSSWDPVTNPINTGGYIWSHGRQQFIGWEGEEIFFMSTIGTFSAVADVTLESTVSIHAMWTLRGMLFLRCSNNLPEDPTRYEIRMSRDNGLTWEFVTFQSIGNGTNIQTNPQVQQPSIGYTPGHDNQYVIANFGDDYCMAPLYQGLDFAAPLAP